MTDTAKKYLIVGPAWVGDMVMAQSLFIDLKERQQGCHIDVLAPAWTAALIDRMPEVSQLVAGNFAHGELNIGGRFRLGRALRNEQYTHSIVLPNSLKSALVPALARIPSRAGFLGEQRWGLLNDVRRLDKSVLSMTVQRFIALGRRASSEVIALEDVPMPALTVTSEQGESVMRKNSLQADSPILVLCPGAEFGVSKMWPADHYAALAQHYLDQGWQVWLMGSEKDLPSCLQINHKCSGAASILAGKTSLPEAIDLISMASLVVSNDSGLMHIAAALQIPLVAVYGSTDPGHTPPLSRNHVIARNPLDCSPCFKRECPLHHHNCMQLLNPSQVIELAQGLH